VIETWGLVLAAALILLNGFFVAAEFALVRLRVTQLRSLAQSRGLRGRLLARMHRQLDAYLSATQLGITLASLALGWVGEPATARLLAPALKSLGFGEDTDLLRSTALTVGFALIAFLTIILGELVPKSLAIRRSVNVALWVSIPLYAFYWFMFPAIWLLNACSQWVLRLFALRGREPQEDVPHSRDELAMILALSQAQGVLGRRSGDLLERALDFNELSAGDLARPAADMVCLQRDASVEELRRELLAHRFTRYPVCAGDRQHIVGLVHVKDLLAELSRPTPDLQMKNLLRPLPAVHKDLPALDLLTHFRSGQPHFALVADDLGTITGFVTLDHVLEALIGPIPDEFGHRRRDWVAQADGSWLGSGSLSIYSLERILGRDIDEAGEADSIGGLLMQRLERLPESGERVSFRDFDVLVRERQGPRIALVQVFPHPAADDEDWFS